MLTLPTELFAVIVAFAHLFSKPVWESAKLLIAGAILAPGKRTITALLRVLGKSMEKNFQTYHRLFNRARWSTLDASRILLFGIDDTIERRRGDKISAKGIYRDPVRSSRSHFVKASGLRWLCCMLMCDLSWVGCCWALPFLTVLCPSERFYQQRGRAHQTLIDRAWQIIQLLARWLPTRSLVFVADSSFAVIELLAKVRGLPNASLISRLRLDAALYERAPARKAGQKGRPRLKGKRRPTLKAVLDDPKTEWRTLKVDNWYGEGEREVELSSQTALWYHCGLPPVEIRWVLIRDPQGKFDPQALLSTNLEHSAEEIVRWFVKRWRMEVTFEEARAHLGMETQRQWNDLAIGRTTPALMGLFSIVTLVWKELWERGEQKVRVAAWYEKKRPTFTDAIALVRRKIWSEINNSMSGKRTEMIKIPRKLFERLTDTVCYAA